MRAWTASLVLTLVACAGAAPVAQPPQAHTDVGPDAGPSSTASSPTTTPAPLEELIPGFRITNYTLAREADLSGQRTGNRTRISAKGLPGQYAWEFLCSGRGVAMQGTGVTLDGKYVHYVSGGGGFCGRDKNLCNCKGAEFAITTGVFGSTGRALTENYSIAVDPTVIPYGSFVWIDAMKRWFRADDTGGAIKGRHIDVYRRPPDSSADSGRYLQNRRIFVVPQEDVAGYVKQARVAANHLPQVPRRLLRAPSR